MEVVVNFAAETHVDRSITSPLAFHESNTAGVVTLLEVCRSRDLGFLQASTDELYGSAVAERSSGPNLPQPKRSCDVAHDFGDNYPK